MKTKIFLILIIAAFFSREKTMAQATNMDENTNEYAILKFGRSMGNFSADIFFDHNKTVNLYKLLNLDTVKLPEYDQDYTYLLKGLNYMDKSGYELVSSSMIRAPYVPLTREYVFRKKRTMNK